MTMELGNFELQSMSGDKLKPSDITQTPLLIKILDYRTGIKTQYEEAAEAVVLDVFNLVTQETYLGVLWFNQAIRDNLKRYIGQHLPIELRYQQPKKVGGNAYIVPVGLEGENLAAAQAWATQRPNLFSEVRAERGEGEYGSDAPAPQDAQPAFQPVATGPTASTPDMSKAAAAQPPAASAPATAPQPPAASGPAIQPPAASAPAASAPAADDDEPPF